MDIYINDRKGNELRETKTDLMTLFRFIKKHPYILDTEDSVFTEADIKLYLRRVNHMHEPRLLGYNEDHSPKYDDGKHEYTISLSSPVFDSLVGVLSFAVDQYCGKKHSSLGTYKAMLDKATPRPDHRLAQLKEDAWLEKTLGKDTDLQAR